MIRDLFNRQYAKKDILAGLTLAVESVPDGMAVGTLAAINPMNGVYAYMMGGLPSPKKADAVIVAAYTDAAAALLTAELIDEANLEATVSVIEEVWVTTEED